MKKIQFILSLFGLPFISLAQDAINPEMALQTSAPSTNAVSNMAAADSGIYFGSGSGLNFFFNHSFTEIKTGFSNLDDFGVYSVSTNGKRVFFSTATVKEVREENVTTGLRYGYSENAGLTWKELNLPLDSVDADIIFFGSDTIKALPVIVPEQFVTYDSDLSGDSIWVATWAGGIRLSPDKGSTWKRILLPPDDRDSISPDSSYYFYFSPVERTVDGIRDGGDLNFLGFSVHITPSGAIWAGTAGGINVEYAPNAWKKFTHSPEPTSLTGNWITAIRSRTVNNSDEVWAVCWRALGSSEDFGLAFTNDNGETWIRTLTGTKIYDLAFSGNYIIATGDDGVFISDDGIRWHQRKSFIDPVNRLVIPYAAYFSVAVEPVHNQWLIGSSQGLLIPEENNPLASDYWQINRRDLSGEKDVVFAYPNPFSPDDDRYCRFRFPVSDRATVTILSTDHLIVNKLASPFTSGFSEILWDGRDANGNRISNGVYLFHIESDKGEFWGKLLILE